MVLDGLAAEPVGVVLSGGGTRGFSFVVLEGREDDVEEGKYVMVREGSTHIVAMIEGLEYYHEFYQEQDVWIASIRRGRRIPEDLAARQYLRATARTVAGVPEGGGDGLVRVKRPPRPGSLVYLVGPDVLKLVLGWDPEHPEDAPAGLIPLGYLLGYEKRYHAYLDLKALTMHFAVMGTTGSGKSNTMGVVLEELGKKRETDVGLGDPLPGPVPALVVDVNNDYVDFYREESIVGNYTEVVRLVLRNSLAERYGARGHRRARLVRLVLDLNELSGAELAEAVVTLYRRGPSESAVLQLGYLEQLFSDHDRLCGEKDTSMLCGREGRLDYNRIFSDPAYFDALLSTIDRDAQGEERRVDPRTAQAVKRQLRGFYELLHKYGLIDPLGERFNRGFIDRVTEPGSPRLVLLDLGLEGATGASLAVKQFIVYYVARVLFNAFVSYKLSSGEDRVLLFVIEEAQNFAPNLAQYPIGHSIARSVLSLVATQGRKFGLSLALVTQRPKYVDPTILNMMNTFIIHRVPPADVGFVENVTGGLPQGLKQNLTQMERGLAIVVGQMNPSPQPLLVKVRKRERHEVSG